MSKQKGRRGNNEGSIYKRKDGRWCAEATIGFGDDGKPIRKYLYGKERKEVAKKLMPYVKNYFDFGSLTTNNQKSSFMSALNEWFLLYKVPVIKSPTQEKLRNFIKNHIDPAFANFEMNEIDVTKCQCFFNGLIQKGLCQESIKHIKQLLNQFFIFAVKNHLAASNPINEVKISCNIRRDEKTAKMALSQTQRKQVLYAASNDHVLKPIIIVLMFTGIRPGELLALKWENVDFSTSIMHIRGALSPVFADSNSIYREWTAGRITMPSLLLGFVLRRRISSLPFAVPAPKYSKHNHHCFGLHQCIVQYLVHQHIDSRCLGTTRS